MREHFKKKLARSSLTWAGPAEMKNWQRKQMLSKWRGKDRHCDGDCLKRPRERRRRMEKKFNR